VADLRDPLTGRASAATRGLRHRAQVFVERCVARRASHVVFTTRGALADFHERYPAFPAARLHVVENGYDEGDFQAAEALCAAAVAKPALATPSVSSPEPLLLLHSGLVSDAVRTPRALLQALAHAFPGGKFHGHAVRVVFRGSQAEAEFRPLTAALGLEPWVEWLPALPYREALVEMLQASGLLLMQGEQNNPQVPAKVYEYFRAGRPVLGLVGEGSECAALLAAEGLGATAPLEDAAAIERALHCFLEQVLGGTAPVMSTSRAGDFSREGRAAGLAKVLAAATSGAGLLSPRC
jgi:glycosyltransferase involved in cell wall biosynthesis